MRGAGPEEGTATLIRRARPLQRILGNSQLYKRSPQPATAGPYPAEVSRSSAAAISLFLLGAVLLLLIATRRRGRKRGRGGGDQRHSPPPGAPSRACAPLLLLLLLLLPLRSAPPLPHRPLMAALSSAEPRARLAPPHIAQRTAEARRQRQAWSSPARRARGAGPSRAARPQARADAEPTDAASPRAALFASARKPAAEKYVGAASPALTPAARCRELPPPPPGLGSGPPWTAGKGAAGRGLM